MTMEKETNRGGLRPIRALEDDFPDYKSRKDVELGVREVNVRDIVGVTRLNQPRFNRDWTPTEQSSDQRWLDIVEFVQKNGRIPEDRNPIELVLLDGKYYVDTDGCRRVAAAHLFKLEKVTANVIEYRKP